MYIFNECVAIIMISLSRTQPRAKTSVTKKTNCTCIELCSKSMNINKKATVVVILVIPLAIDDF